MAGNVLRTGGAEAIFSRDQERAGMGLVALCKMGVQAKGGEFFPTVLWSTC